MSGHSFDPRHNHRQHRPKRTRWNVSTFAGVSAPLRNGRFGIGVSANFGNRRIGAYGPRYYPGRYPGAGYYMPYGGFRGYGGCNRYNIIRPCMLRYRR